jgi:glycosyltransferase 2 family protein
MDANRESDHNLQVHRKRPATTAEAVIDRLRRRFIVGLAFGVLVIVALVVISDGPALYQTLREFQWWLFPLILLLTSLNYVLRFVKWEFYLSVLDVPGLSKRTSLGIFLAGLAMAITPGKVGEILKAFLVREATGTPMTRTAPIPLGERLTDGIAMLLLASVGLLSFQYGWQLLLIAGLGAIALILIVQRRPLVHWIIDQIGRIPKVSRRTAELHELYDSTFTLLKNRNLVIATTIGLVSWAFECLAFYLILIGLGLPANREILVLAFFVLASATILGSLSMLPGGLGAAEASVAGLLLLLVTNPVMTTETAGAATLLIRFATLWFGVIIGIGALFYIQQHIRNLPTVAAARKT